MLNDRLADLIQGRHPAIRSVVIVRSSGRMRGDVLARIQAPCEEHEDIQRTLDQAIPSFQPRGLVLTYQLIPPVIGPVRPA